MTSKVTPIALSLLLSMVSMFASTPEWGEEKMRAIEALKSKPVHEQIQALGPLVEIGVPHLGDPPISDAQRSVYEEAQRLLLGIEGHADYYARLIRAKQERLTETTPDDPSFGERQADFRNSQVEGFGILGQLPSVETVRVLGEFLSDDRGRVPPSPPGQADDRNKRQRDSGITPNSSYALRSLARLPLVSKPTNRPGNFIVHDEDIDIWRIWYDQVKAGTRTFQFEGNPTRYNLKGVAMNSGEKAEPKKNSEEAVSLDSRSIAKKDGSVLFILAFVAALGVLGVAAWQTVLRGRKNRSESS